MQMRRAAFALMMVASPLVAHAEVMDKELSIPQIWQALLWALAFGTLAAALWRWLLILSLLAGLATGLAFAWTEWFDPSVGPAIRVEAGAVYGAHVHAALSLLLVAHVAGWLLASRWSVAARRRTPSGTPVAGTGATLIFAGAVAALTALAASSGFGGSPVIWVSPPIWVAGAFLAWATIAYVRATRVRLSVV